MPSRVLIVDANLASNVLLSKTLSKAGLETRTAFTSDEAMVRIGQDRFDAIVADLGMPNGDSKALLNRLTQSGTAEQVPILALSEGLEDQLAKSALQLGATEILPKPVAADALVQRVKRAIERGPRGQQSRRITKADRKNNAESAALALAPPSTAPVDAPDLSGVDTTAFEPTEPASAREAPEARPASPPAPPPAATRSPAPTPPAGKLGTSGATPTAAGSLSTAAAPRAARLGETGAQSLGAPSTDKGKSGVSTIQLDAKNFVDKTAHQAPASDASPLAEGDELRLERRSYTVLRRLAAGAMGGTFLVKRTGDRGSAYAEELECVLKVSFGDPVADESLRVEQLTLGSIDHPNVVKLLDMGFLPGQDGARFVVLERLYPLPSTYFGKDKDDLPPHERATDPVTAMRAYLNLVGGLHAIHAKHRLILGDIKPDNIMLRMAPLDEADPRADYARKLARGDFEPVFIDFGSALSQEVLRTRKVETFTGSPAYMAPEVLTLGRHSARRDVFALSVTLYELLTGLRPYGDLGGRPVGELLDAIKRGVSVVDLERVRSLRFDEGFSEAVGTDPAAARAQFLRSIADMIARGCERDPSQRYSTYQLADECRIRFQVRPRQSPLAGARYESPIFAPLDPAALRYTAPPRPEEETPQPAPELDPGRHSKSGRLTKSGRQKDVTGGGAGDPYASQSPGAGTPVGHSASTYTSGSGLLGPPPAAPLSGAAGGAQAAAVRRLEIENAELRIAFLRSEERVQAAEEAAAERLAQAERGHQERLAKAEKSVQERDRTLRAAEERARQLDDLARDRDQKRLEASERAKKALERATKAEEALVVLQGALAEAEALLARKQDELRAVEATLGASEKALDAAEARAGEAEAALAGSAPLIVAGREAQQLLTSIRSLLAEGPREAAES